MNPYSCPAGHSGRERAKRSATSRPRRALGVSAAIAVTLTATGAASATTVPPTDPASTESTITITTPAGSAGGNPAGCVDGAETGADLFPDKFDVQHAENYTLTYAETYKILTVAETSPGAGEHTYVLAQCGTDVPALEDELAGATVVEIPVTTMFSESTSHNGFIDVLDIEGTVTGVADASVVVTPSLRDRIDSGEVDSFAVDFVVDAETVVASDPDVYVTGGGDDPAHEAITAAGVPVVANAEWLETTPEGWAEWVGLFAALTNTEARANQLYGAWISDYAAAASLVVDVAERPTVITGGLFEGTWYASGGDGIVAEFIADAGGDYVYDDDRATGSIELDIESVLADGADADVWLLPSGFSTEEDGLTIDERYGEFDAWNEEQVWTNEAPTDPTVSFIEQGPVMIDEYLLDYIKVLHPDLVPDHELVFFSEVE